MNRPNALSFPNSVTFFVSFGSHMNVSCVTSVCSGTSGSLRHSGNSSSSHRGSQMLPDRMCAPISLALLHDTDVNFLTRGHGGLLTT